MSLIRVRKPHSHRAASNSLLVRHDNTQYTGLYSRRQTRSTQTSALCAFPFSVVAICAKFVLFYSLLRGTTRANAEPTTQRLPDSWLASFVPVRAPFPIQLLGPNILLAAGKPGLRLNAPAVFVMEARATPQLARPSLFRFLLVYASASFSFRAPTHCALHHALRNSSNWLSRNTFPYNARLTPQRAAHI